MSKEVNIKADRVLFAQMITIAENRNLKMNDVHLGSLPWALALTDGSLKITNKASFANAKGILKDVPAADVIP